MIEIERRAAGTCRQGHKAEIFVDTMGPVEPHGFDLARDKMRLFVLPKMGAS